MVLDTKLTGTHALVTGGTKGIGKAFVEALVSEGCTVSYCARNVSGAEFAGLSGPSGAATYGTAVDVGDRNAIYRWVKDSGEKLGRIDIVISNASPMHFESTPENWVAAFNADLMGFVNLVEASLPYLEKSSQPSVIVISSFMGREFFRSPAAPYGPMKAAQLQHVQELSHMLGPKGVRVNAISPGPIIFPGGAWEQYSEAAPDWVASKVESIPLKRFGTPEEMAKVAVFLASPLSSYVQGTNILADGGIHVGTSY